MAIGWLSVLKMVPWGDVMSNAPKLANEAKKLWSTVAKTPPAAEPSRAKPKPALSPDSQSITLLQADLKRVIAEIADLHQQMLESSQLIKALADQNTQLIRRMEMQRIRTLWLAGLAAVLGGVAVINLVITLTR